MEYTVMQAVKIERSAGCVQVQLLMPDSVHAVSLALSLSGLPNKRPRRLMHALSRAR